MAEVWALSSGSYSDYGVIGICSSEEEANRIRDELNDNGTPYGDVFVEEFQSLDGAKTVKELHLNFAISEEGQITSEQERYNSHLESEWNKPCSWHYYWHVWKGEGSGVFSISGTDHERVRKVYSEKKAYFIANEVERRMNHSST